MKRHLLFTILIAIGLLSAVSLMLRLPTNAYSPNPVMEEINRYEDTGANLAITTALTDSVSALYAAWVQRYPADAPPARMSHAMVYDSSRGKTLLFGGYNSNSGRMNDTWEWDGINWTQRSPVTSLPVRQDHAMSYDKARGRVVLFGGISSSGSWLDDTWEWDGTDWTQKFPTIPPSTRTSPPEMTYNSDKGVVTLVDGYGYIYEWDGTNWVRISTAAFPVDNSYAMAYDNNHHVIIIYGGIRGGNVLDETWQWDGINWTLRTPIYSPGSRIHHKMTYNEVRSRIILFAGFLISPYVNQQLRDTCEWDGDNWVHRQLNPPLPLARESHDISYDSEQATVVLFGGTNADTGVLSDTWEYQSVDLWVTPITRTIAQTDMTTFTINVNGTPLSVTLERFFLPQGISGWFTPSVITPPAQSTLVLTSSSTVVDGSNSIGIAGYIGGGQRFFVYVDLVIERRDIQLIPSAYYWQTYPGTDITHSLTVTATPNITAPVALELSDLPQGVEVIFATNPITPNSTVNIRVLASAAAEIGVHTIIITGTVNGLTYTVPVTLTVLPNSITPVVLPDSKTIYQGESATYSITVGATPGITQVTQLTVDGLSDADIDIYPPVIQLGNPVEMTVTTSLNTVFGERAFTVTASSEDVTGTTTAMLELLPANIALVASPSTRTLLRGHGTYYTLDYVTTPGFTLPMTLTSESFPSTMLYSPISYSFEPSVIIPDQQSTLFVTTTLSAELGTYNFVISGTTSQLTCSTNVTLEVKSAVYLPIIMRGK